MDAPVEHIRVSQTAKDKLVKLKRLTRIKQWNILCRWAFCVSLSEPSAPGILQEPTDSNVDMTWRVFGGPFAEVYTAILKERCHQDGLGMSPPELAEQFRRHLHRGIGYLSATNAVTDISSLLKRLASQQ